MATDRGLWLYPRELYNPYRISPTTTSVRDWVIARNAAAPATPIKYVYCAASAAAMQDATWLAWFRTMKSTLPAGTKFLAAGGVPEWGLAGNLMSSPYYMQAANWAYQVLQPLGPRTVGEGNFWRIFDGVMLDVEPAWLFGPRQNVTQAQINAWVQMQAQVQAMVNSRACNPGGSASAVFWSVLQFWLNEFTTPSGPLDRALMKLTHGTAVMSYRDTVGPAAGPNGSIISVSAPIVASAAATGIPLRLTVECDPTGTSYVDYSGQSRALMESHLSQVMTYLTTTTNNPMVKGIDVHQFGSWSTMAA